MDEISVDNLTYSARRVYQSTPFPQVRITIARLFQGADANGVIAELCGDSGFRIVPFGGKAIPLTGAESTLSTLCWYPAPKKRKRSASQGRMSTAVRFEDGRSYFGRSGGRKRGSDVHDEIEHYVCWPQERFDATHPKVDPMSHAVIIALVERNIKCIDSGRIVFDRDWRIGTALDLVGMMRKTGEFIAFELKTGSDGCFDTPDDPSHSVMRTPFHEISNTPLNRARFQLLLGIILAERTFHVKFPHAYVIHVPSSHKPAILHTLGPVLSYYSTLVTVLDAWRAPNTHHPKRTISSVDMEQFFSY